MRSLSGLPARARARSLWLSTLAVALLSCGGNPERQPPLYATRRYRPAHNLGHYRFVECGKLREGRPDGNLAPWDEIRFPFDPTLREHGDLAAVDVRRLDGEGPEIEERYCCTAAGTFEVTLAVLDDGFSRTYRIARPTSSNGG